jgi:phospholipid/cholesterol/gamma-HCH transport system substrate-binding protein
VNIVPGHGQATLAAEKSLLPSRQPLEMDEMLRILGESGSNILRISEGMKLAVDRLNSSKAFWKLLDNPSLGQNIEQSAANIQMASKEAVTITQQIDSLLRGVQQGKGNLGMLFKDSTIALQLEASASRISLLAGHTDSLAENLNGLVNMIKEEASTGNGTVHALLKDSILVQRIHKSLEEIEKGGRAFRQDMEALQHNFLLRPYFRKKEKEAARQKKKSAE